MEKNKKALKTLLFLEVIFLNLWIIGWIVISSLYMAKVFIPDSQLLLQYSLIPVYLIGLHIAYFNYWWKIHKDKLFPKKAEGNKENSTT